MTKSDRMSHFVVNFNKEWKSSKYFALDMMRVMRCNLSDNYQLHAYGKINVRLCEEISLLMHRWMQIINIETGFTKANHTDCYMVIFFKRSVGFTDSFKK